MEVRFLTGLLFLWTMAQSLTPKLNNLSVLRQLDKQRQMKKKEAHQHVRRFDSHSFMNEYKHPSDQKRKLQGGEEFSADDSFVDLSFENREVTQALNFIEFKMNEINTLIQECIDSRFEVDLSADIADVRKECIGASYQILILNYQESMRKVKDILIEIVKIKLESLQKNNNDEINFFLDIIDQLIDADYSLPETLHIVKSSAQFYVSPMIFDKIIDMAKTELQAFHVLHKRLRDARVAIQKNLESHGEEEENEEENIKLQHDVTQQLETAFPAPGPDAEGQKEEMERDEEIHHESPEMNIEERRRRERKKRLMVKIKRNMRHKRHLMQSIPNTAKTNTSLIINRNIHHPVQNHKIKVPHHKFSRELTDGEKEPQLEHGDEMGWIADNGKRGNDREDIMGAA